MSRTGYANFRYYSSHASQHHRDYAEPHNWEARTYLKEIRNQELFCITEGDFPKPRWGESMPDAGSHPVFLLERNGNMGFTFCPCSTREGNASTCSHIRKDTPLLRVNRPVRMRDKTYILHQYPFNLPEDNHVAGRGNFLGVVPENGIVGEDYKKWKRR